MRFLALLTLALPLAAQSYLDLNQIRAEAAMDAIVINLGGKPALGRAAICQDRTGATCPLETPFFIDASGALRIAPIVFTVGRRGPVCQTPPVISSPAPNLSVQITEATFVPNSLMVFLNGQLMNRSAVGEIQPDYVLTGTSITLNREVTPKTVVQVCYSY